METPSLTSTATSPPELRTHGERLLQRIHDRRAVVGILGMGYVGLPLACAFAEAGLRVFGFDTDGEKVKSLRAGRSYLRHIPNERLLGLRAVERSSEDFAGGGAAGIFASDDAGDIAHCDALLICVPTPVTEGREPDLAYVRSSAETVARHLRPGQLVVLESTTYPGTTEEEVGGILAESDLCLGGDYFLAFSPEREDPGNEHFSTRTIPKIVGGVTPASGDLAAALYGIAIDRIVPVSNAAVAESAKLLENIFRSVNIALVNELKMLFDRMGIDVWEVIEAASTKPFGFMPFKPGPGLGGHCIPIDPFYLSWRARQFDFSTRFIELAGEINTAMPEYVVARLLEALSTRGVALRGAKILVLGVAYKPGVDDLRESPALKLIHILQGLGAKVGYHDPYVPSLKVRKLRRYEGFELESEPLTPETLGEADCVLIATDHPSYDYAEIVERSKLVVDTRNATKGIQDARIVKA